MPLRGEAGTSARAHVRDLSEDPTKVASFGELQLVEDREVRTCDARHGSALRLTRANLAAIALGQD